MTFAERARPLKDRKGCTNFEIAEAVGISESMVSRYLGGKIDPPDGIAQKILEYLGGDLREEEREDADMQPYIDHIKDLYEGRITDLKETIEQQKRDKAWMARSIVLLVAVIVYLFLDALHGNWGIFQYPVV